MTKCSESILEPNLSKHCSKILIASVLILTTILFVQSATARPKRVTQLECITSDKHNCEPGVCQSAEVGFADAERYWINSKNVTACLWSTCFTGPVLNIKKSDSETVFAGRLPAENGSDSLTLTFSLLQNDRFSATYFTGGQGMSVVFGRCNRR